MVPVPVASSPLNVPPSGSIVALSVVGIFMSRFIVPLSDTELDAREPHETNASHTKCQPAAAILDPMKRSYRQSSDAARQAAESQSGGGDDGRERGPNVSATGRPTKLDDIKAQRIIRKQASLTRHRARVRARVLGSP
jgi:hypothetical protein